MHPAPAGLSIRWRIDGEESALYAVDQRANRLFIEHGMAHVAENSWPEDVFRSFVRRHDCLVAEISGQLAGYVVCGEDAGAFWVKELAVDPAFQRRGIGAALVSEVVERAKWAFHNAVCLTTFRDLPFNAPFYVRLGFMTADLEAAAPEIRNIFEREVPHGSAPDERVLMIRRL